jgi:hypothetical protein
MMTLAQAGAYCRLYSLICASGDALRDNDKQVGRGVGALGAWPRIKADLIAMGAITIEGGFIRQPRCSAEVARSRQEQSQKVLAGRARAQQRDEMGGGGYPQGMVSEVGAQVIEIVEGQGSGCSQIKIKKEPYPSGKAPAGAGRATKMPEVDTSEWDSLDLDAEQEAEPTPAAEPVQPPPLSVVPMPDLTPEQRIRQAERRADEGVVDALQAVGVAKSSAWGLMAKWKKAIGRDKLLGLIAEVHRNPPRGPVAAWMTRMVQNEVDRTAGRRRSQERRGYGDY